MMEVANANQSNEVVESNTMEVSTSGSGEDNCRLTQEEGKTCEDASAAVEVDDGEVYKTDEAAGDGGGDDKSMKTCVLRMLDEMDCRVEKLRSDTLKVEAERDDILTTLDTLNNSQLVHNLDGIELDEVSRYIKRLAQRTAAVRVEISTERSIPQQESLHLVNTLIDAMIREVKSDVGNAKRRCASYMNSCSDSPDSMFQQNCGIDAAFEQAVLGCTLEDQKRVKKRLSGLYSYFATYSPSLTEIKEERCEEKDTDGNASPRP